MARMNGEAAWAAVSLPFRALDDKTAMAQLGTFVDHWLPAMSCARRLRGRNLQLSP
jgi:hypothetical protein